MTKYFGRHNKYFSNVWNVSLGIAGVYAFLNWIWQLFKTAADGNLIGFLFTFIFQSVIMGITMIIGGVFIFLVIVIITFIPYLIWRGLTSRDETEVGRILN